ncbi:DUF3089 domain-containing protein [Sphingosinicellaceae bacterium]|nr:DUF3089 domain-containing protein [Sphingosinicellaceae bacterium]
MYARRFLWIIAVLVFVGIAAAFFYALNPVAVYRTAFTPTMKFEATHQANGPDYSTPAGWDAHPGLPHGPAQWTPPGYAVAPKPRVAVFFVTPTAYLGRDRWNMPFGDSATDTRIAIYLKGEASAFNGIGEVWAPRYRQAAFGAFFTAKPDATRAIDLAYHDVSRAWDVFLAAQPKDRPIILAAHSQGSLHLLRLLRERLKGTPVMQRIVAAYIVGWPISVAADLPALGLPACNSPIAIGCILAWQSFAEPADAKTLRVIFDSTPGYTGIPRDGTPVLCTNPMTGMSGAEQVPASRNLGALIPDAGLGSATLVVGRVPARCSPEGLLLVGPPPVGFGDYVLPGNNYHVYDYALFWANVRADAEARAGAMPAPAPQRVRARHRR